MARAKKSPNQQSSYTCPKANTSIAPANPSATTSPAKTINKRFWQGGISLWVGLLLVVLLIIAWGYAKLAAMPLQPKQIISAKVPVNTKIANQQNSNNRQNLSDTASQQYTALPVSLDEVTIDKVYVDKSARIMQLISGDNVVRQYHIALGKNPKGHKQQEGDERTPEGVYTLDYKNENSIAYRSIHISYPNAADKAAAKARGVSAGGAIMIHGQMNGYEHLTDYFQQRDWTDGCIAVTNDEMDEIMEVVEIGTPIEIVW